MFSTEVGVFVGIMADGNKPMLKKLNGVYPFGKITKACLEMIMGTELGEQIQFYG